MDPDGFSSSLDLMKTVGAFCSGEEPSGDPSIDPEEILSSEGSDPDWKGSKYIVQVEWETGEITFEPLSIIAADDPVTCAAYAKENDLLALEGWRRFRSLAKKDKVLARAIKQS